MASPNTNTTAPWLVVRVVTPLFLTKALAESMDNALGRCQSMIQSCYDSESAWTCVPASIYCNNALLAPYQRTGQNVYDIAASARIATSAT